MPAGLATRPVAALVPAARNARTHSTAQVAAIAASIVEFGFNNPVLIDAAGGIIAGHGRVLAAQQLGLPDVPVVVLGHLSETQRRAYLLADNRLAELASWDDTLLAGELEALAGLDVNLAALGFDATALEALGVVPQAPRGGAGDPDAVPPMPERPASRLGDTWCLGGHRLICGDSTDAAVRAQALGPRGAPDAVFTDPPYGVSYASRVDPQRRKPWGGIANDELRGEPLARLIGTAICPARVRYVCADWTAYPLVVAALGAPKTVCIWVKQHFGLGKGYRRQHELVLFYGTLNRTDLSDVWRIERALDYAHPTQKPVALAMKALADAAATDVYDPFAGAGSTVVAAELLGRPAAAVEIDPRYVDVAVRRWQTFTGRVATLEASGESFVQVQRARGHAARQAG